MSFQEQMTFSQTFMPTVKHIIKKMSSRFMRIDDATFFEDINGTDLIINYPGRVLCSTRIRRIKNKHYQDITIRLKSRGGVSYSADIKDLAKYCKKKRIKQKIFFYGYGIEKTLEIPNFIIIDFVKLSDQIISPTNLDIFDRKRRIKVNSDGSQFIPIDFSELRKMNCVIVEFDKECIIDSLDKYLKKIMEV